MSHFWPMSASCHHVSGWSIFKDDMEIEFGQRRAQSDLNVQYAELSIWKEGRGKGDSRMHPSKVLMIGCDA